MGKKLTTEEFIVKAIEKHGDLYGYDKVVYTNNKTKIKIWCNACKGYFYQTPGQHIYGNKGKGEGCLGCSGTKLSTIEDFIIKARKKHDDLYSYDDARYINANTKVKIYCKKCEDYFEQSPRHHIYGNNNKGSGCPICFGTKKLTIEDFTNRLTMEEEPIEINGDIRCRCTFCKEYFTPTRRQLYSRVFSLSGKGHGEQRLYCSDNCKQNCPIFRQRKYYKDQDKPDRSREVQPELRQLTLERDYYTCQICDTKEKDLHCHHYTGVEVNPVESADIDNCITLCDSCHRKVHDQPGCTYNDFKRKPCKI